MDCHIKLRQRCRTLLSNGCRSVNGTVRFNRSLGPKPSSYICLHYCLLIISAVRATEGRETGVYGQQAASGQTQRPIEQSCVGMPDAVCVQ